MPAEIESGSMVCSAKKGCEHGARLLVLGLGNILLSDEGVGVHITEQLQKQHLPGNVEVIDGGTAALDVLLLQQGPYKLVVIDAIRAGNKPGTIYKIRLKGQQKDRLTEIFGKVGQSKISLHQVGLLDALGVAKKIGRAPAEVVVIGVEPGEVGFGLELTAKVKRSVPKVIKEVLKEIKKRISATKTQSHEGKK